MGGIWSPSDVYYSPNFAREARVRHPRTGRGNAALASTLREPGSNRCFIADDWALLNRVAGGNI